MKRRGEEFADLLKRAAGLGNGSFMDFPGTGSQDYRPVVSRLRLEVSVYLEKLSDGPYVIRRKGQCSKKIALSTLKPESVRLLNEYATAQNEHLEVLTEIVDLKEEIQETGGIIKVESGRVKKMLKAKYPEHLDKGELSLKLIKGDDPRILLMADGFEVKGAEVELEFGLPLIDYLNICRAAENRQLMAEEKLGQYQQRSETIGHSVKGLVIRMQHRLMTDHPEIPTDKVVGINSEEGNQHLLVIHDVDEVLDEMPPNFRRAMILKHLSGREELPFEAIAQFDLGPTLEAIEALLPPADKPADLN